MPVGVCIVHVAVHVCDGLGFDMASGGRDVCVSGTGRDARAYTVHAVGVGSGGGGGGGSCSCFACPCLHAHVKLC